MKYHSQTQLQLVFSFERVCSQLLTTVVALTKMAEAVNMQKLNFSKLNLGRLRDQRADPIAKKTTNFRNNHRAQYSAADYSTQLNQQNLFSSVIVVKELTH